ncbi:MAG TPA: DeoR/GlpR family DNA-binding transcription regulator [Pseudonocardiaceae bacterium]|jgi:DeoR/GlpR family transcriptional regulator of sugar metabolism|nr:DeoR/GlpR family DNA-binding transcription regulator [Pseudonocardiaceae bacterium]
MRLSERHQSIADHVRKSARVSVVELAEVLGTSEVTIRRDLEELARLGVLRRVRGGAVNILGQGEEPPFAMREMQAVEAKTRIAVAVGELIADGEVVALDSGTTGLAVARVLAGRNLTVLPLSLQGANVLADAAPTRVILPGGELRPVELTAVGPLAEATLRALRFDTAVITCCGVSVAAGPTAYRLADAAVKLAAIDSATRVVLAADSSKFTRSAMAVIAPLTRIDVLVTDAALPAAVAEEITTLGIEVRHG